MPAQGGVSGVYPGLHVRGKHYHRILLDNVAGGWWQAGRSSLPHESVPAVTAASSKITRGASRSGQRSNRGRTIGLPVLMLRASAMGIENACVAAPGFPLSGRSARRHSAKGHPYKPDGAASEAAMVVDQRVGEGVRREQ
jgi:hypothetical protein